MFVFLKPKYITLVLSGAYISGTLPISSHLVLTTILQSNPQFTEKANYVLRVTHPASGIAGI